MIQGKSIEQWQVEYPLLKKIINTDEVFWLNPKYQKDPNNDVLEITLADIKEAEARLKRFAPYIQEVFPETKESNGIIESALEDIDDFKSELVDLFNTDMPGQLYIKRDDNLPIAGSIKAKRRNIRGIKICRDLSIRK